MNTTTILKYIVAPLAAFLLIFFWGFGCGYKANVCTRKHDEKVQGVQVPEPVVIHDTVEVPKYVRVIDFQANGKKVYVDSLSREMDSLTTKTVIGTPFIARLDTTIDSVGIKVKYQHPQNLFTVMLQRPPQMDRYITTAKVVPFPVEIVKERSVWVDAIHAACYIGFGYVAHSVVYEVRD